MPRTGPGLGSAAEEIRRDASLGLQAAAGLFLEQVGTELSTPGRGRLYQKYAPKRLHQASIPGDPPAPDTGVLRNSIAMAPTESGFRVGTNLEYAEYLEFGTARIAPRPFMRTAIAKVETQLGPEIVATIRRRRGDP